MRKKAGAGGREGVNAGQVDGGNSGREREGAQQGDAELGAGSRH